LTEHPPAQRRLFFALWPDDAVRERLRAALAAMPPRGGRPVHVEDLHLTLVFLGRVDPDRQACAERVAAAVHAEQFVLRIDRQGYWPAPRVAWCAPGEVPDALRGLVRRLTRALEACGFAPERRPYRPHVTLFRHSRAVPTGPLTEPFDWPCRAFVLVESARAGDGPRYRVLGGWPLADSCVEPPAVP
jgi:2'-5' RNA ligase